MAGKWYKVTSGYNDQELKMATVENVNFSSSWLSRGQWDPITQRCIVTFKDGYQWSGSMTSDMWNSLKSASSKGRWWWSQKGNPAFWSKR